MAASQASLLTRLCIARELLLVFVEGFFTFSFIAVALSWPRWAACFETPVMCCVKEFGSLVSTLKL